VINGNGGHSTLAASLGGSAAEPSHSAWSKGWQALVQYSAGEPDELSQWLCRDDNTTNYSIVIM